MFLLLYRYTEYCTLTLWVCLLDKFSYEFQQFFVYIFRFMQIYVVYNSSRQLTLPTLGLASPSPSSTTSQTTFFFLSGYCSSSLQQVFCLHYSGSLIPAFDDTLLTVQHPALEPVLHIQDFVIFTQIPISVSLIYCHTNTIQHILLKSQWHSVIRIPLGLLVLSVDCRIGQVSLIYSKSITLRPGILATSNMFFLDQCQKLPTGTLEITASPT